MFWAVTYAKPTKADGHNIANKILK